MSDPKLKSLATKGLDRPVCFGVVSHPLLAEELRGIRVKPQCLGMLDELGAIGWPGRRQALTVMEADDF